jgi:hypothetical protein
VDAVKNAIGGLLDDPAPHAAARALAAEFARWDSAATFRAFVDEVVARSAPAPSPSRP